MKLEELKGKTVGVCVSGGLDSKTICCVLLDAGVKVKAFSANVGQPDEKDINDIKKRMAPTGVVRRRLLELHGHRARGDGAGPPAGDEEGRLRGARARRDGPRQRPDALRALHERARPEVRRVRPLARRGAPQEVPRPHADGRVPREARHRRLRGHEEEVLHRREPRRPLPRGGGPGEHGDLHAHREAHDGRVAREGAEQGREGHALLREGTLRGRQRQEDDALRGHARGEQDRRPQRHRHEARAREPHHRHEEPRRVRGARHGSAELGPQVHLRGRDGPPLDAPLPAALQARRGPDLRRPLVRPRHPRRPRGHPGVGRQGDGRHHARPLQGQHLLRVPHGPQGHDLQRGRQLDGGLQRTQPAQLAGLRGMLAKSGQIVAK